MKPRLPNRLPAQIVAVTTGTILVFALTLALSVLWLTRALDQQAQADSHRLVDRMLHGLVDRTASVALDYAKWDEAALRVERGDSAWLHRNIGSAASIGLSAHLVVLWGEPLGGEIGWLDQSPPSGTAGLVGMRTVPLVEARLAAIPLDTAQEVSFFAWRGNDLFIAAAARIERSLYPRPGIADADRARILMGRRVTRGELAELLEATQIHGLAISRTEPGAERLAAPLPDVEGRPVGSLSWDPPRPGSALLGRMLPILLPITIFAAGLGFAGIVLSGRNARALVRAQAESNAAAHTDPLTGLPNRTAYNAVLAKPARAGERAVLFMDVNGFKGINDSIGHDAGDMVIARLARRLERLAGPDCFLARIGGDEFVFILSGADVGFRAEWLAQSAQAVLEAPFDVGGGRLMSLHAAIGCALQTSDDMPGEDLVRQADLAMYEAKRQMGSEPVAFAALTEEAREQDAPLLERALRDALARDGEFWIAYQPIVGPDGRLERAEALARWSSPVLGPVPPDRFIAVAEQAGLIVDLGRRLFALICDDLAAHPALRVSINVSPIELTSPDFVPRALEAIAARGIDPRRIVIEITECVMVDDPDLAARRIAELQAAGFSTALDDFGTGYSSLGTLRRMAFDILKIDRSFVSGCAPSPARQELLAALILLAHALELRVVCEGVETEEELELVRGLGCDLAQGFVIERPLTMTAFAARWLRPDEAAAVA